MREQDLLRGLGRQIATLRKAAGLSQEVLGQKVGVTWKTIGNIERGVTFTSLATLYEISRVLNCRLSELFVWAPGPKLKPEEEAIEGLMNRIRDYLASDKPLTLDDAIELLSFLNAKRSKGSSVRSRRAGPHQ